MVGGVAVGLHEDRAGPVGQEDGLLEDEEVPHHPGGEQQQRGRSSGRGTDAPFPPGKLGSEEHHDGQQRQDEEQFGPGEGGQATHQPEHHRSAE